jgi:hypothetical protein
MTFVHFMCVLVNLYGILRTCKCFMSMLVFTHGLMMTSMHVCIGELPWHAKDL